MARRPKKATQEAASDSWEACKALLEARYPALLQELVETQNSIRALLNQPVLPKSVGERPLKKRRKKKKSA